MKSCFPSTTTAEAESEGFCVELGDRSRSVISFISSWGRGVGTIIIGVLVFLVILITTRYLDLDASSIINGFMSITNTNSYTARPHRPPIPIPYTCPKDHTTQPPTCRRTETEAPSPSPSSEFTTSPPPTPSPKCPQYFRYMHEDLKHWKTTGITNETLWKARKYADFRLVVLNGVAYVEQYRRSFQTRDVFTMWGIVQLLNRYPGRVPDLELFFNCGDMPEVKAADYPPPGPPPPLFRYCKDHTSVDIVFPDWSFWGWPEVHIRPWVPLSEDLKNGSERIKWKDREPYAFWKGNPDVSWTRQDLMRCNPSNGKDWNLRAFRQDWVVANRNGFQESDLASQCTYRYKVYIEGRAWSVSEKYILACNSPMLQVTTPYQDFFSRGLIPGLHYWPIRANQKCKSIEFAVDWGNKHPKTAEAMGKAGSEYARNDLKMDYVYDYMLHLLIEYSKLLRYKPTKPVQATEICLESIACPTQGLENTFLMESMERHTADTEPCEALPPFEEQELKETARRNDEVLRKIDKMQGTR